MLLALAPPAHLQGHRRALSTSQPSPNSNPPAPPERGRATEEAGRRRAGRQAARHGEGEGGGLRCPWLQGPRVRGGVAWRRRRALASPPAAAAPTRAVPPQRQAQTLPGVVHGRGTGREAKCRGKVGAANVQGEGKGTMSVALGSAWASRRWRRTASCPLCAARCSAVEPSFRPRQQQSGDA